ncbi:MAG: YbeD family protein [Legionella sp.]
MTNSRQTLIEFPCDFCIKIIGMNHSCFATNILQIAIKHYPDLDKHAIRSQASKQGNYLAVTISVFARDQITLDALYMELSNHPDIKMVL